jgi:hypothetical protein
MNTNGGGVDPSEGAWMGSDGHASRTTGKRSMRVVGQEDDEEDDDDFER